MLRERPMSPRVTPQMSYYATYATVALVMMLGSIGLVWWIVYQLRSLEPPKVTSPIYVNYDATFPAADATDAVKKQWADAQTAYAQYVAQYPEPQNVKILTGWTTAQIYSYMVNQVSAGLKVSCQHCHNVQNFADYNNPNKVRALGMMLMVKDLNENWITLLPASVGNKQVACATCHNGQNAGWDNYPAEVTDLIPPSFRLPLDKQYPGVLTVTGRTDKSLEDVATNQYTMYHMNASLGQGCTFCHNARYFPSYEIAQKQYAVHMLNMASYLSNTGKAKIDIPEVDVPTLLNIKDAQGGEYPYIQLMRLKSPSCWMCHRGARLPGGAVNEGAAPPQLDTVK